MSKGNPQGTELVDTKTPQGALTKYSNLSGDNHPRKKARDEGRHAPNVVFNEEVLVHEVPSFDPSRSAYLISNNSNKSSGGSSNSSNSSKSSNGNGCCSNCVIC